MVQCPALHKHNARIRTRAPAALCVSGRDNVTLMYPHVKFNERQCYISTVGYIQKKGTIVFIGNPRRSVVRTWAVGSTVRFPAWIIFFEWKMKKICDINVTNCYIFLTFCNTNDLTFHQLLSWQKKHKVSQPLPRFGP